LFKIYSILVFCNNYNFVLMKPFYINFKFIAVGILTFLGVFISTISAQTSITTIGVPVTEKFDNLPANGSSGTSSTWANNSTLENWYASQWDASAGIGTVPGSIYLNDGTYVSTNRLSSFGSINNSDRALGFVPGPDKDDIGLIGWRLKNTMLNTTIKGISIKWTIEQWRVINSGNQPITIYHLTSASPITGINKGSLTVSTLTLNSPRTLMTSDLNGNLPINRDSAIHSLNVNIPPGYEILICFGMTKPTLANHYLAIDDVTITAKSDQTIDFQAIGGVKYFGSSPFNLVASATSGLPISYTSSNPEVATISNGQVTITGPGRSTITASQAGNYYYNSALNQDEVLEVRPMTPVSKHALEITSSSFKANWSANNGLNDANIKYTLLYTDDLINGFDNPDWYTPITVKNQVVNNLLPDKIYYYRIYSEFDDALSSSPSEASAITTGTDYVTDTDGEWSNISNWDINGIYHIANSITINNIINLDKDNYPDTVVTNKLFIKSGAKLTSDQKIYVLNELIIEVDADGTAGQIFNKANIVVGSNAKVTVRKTFKSGEWAFIGFPFTVNAADVHIAGTDTQLTWGDLNGTGDYVVQQYDGASRASLNLGNPNYTSNGVYWKDVSPKVFTAKKGYIVYNNNVANVIDFSSTGSNIGSFFSQGVASVSATRHSATNEHRDWNLIATPLSSKFNLGSTSPANSYYAYNGTNYLPALSGENLDVQPFASFFVQALSTSISFANAGRKVVAASRVEEKPVDDIKLVLSNGNNKYDDVTRIRLQDGATAAYEVGTDAVKMFGMNSKVSYIYTAINNTTASINTLPRTVSEVELNTKFAAPGNYSISISNLDKVQSYAAVILVDKVTGKRTDLMSTGSYEYTVGTAGTSNRFKVQFAPKITTGVSVSDDYSLKITSQNGNAYITGLNASAQVRVYDATGKMVFNNTVNNNEPIRLENKGLYIFEIANSEETKKIKTFVR
jgi:hypothetical protein